MKIKILFFIFDLGGGGAEKVLVNLVNNLDPDKYDITIRTVFGGGPNSKRLNSNIRFKPIFKYHPFGGIPKLFKLFSPSFLHKIFISNKYDYEIAYLQHAPTRIIGGSKIKESKKFAWIHIVPESSSHLIHPYKGLKEFSKTYEGFDKIAFVSEEALKEFEKFYDVKVPKFVVHNVNEYGKLDEKASETIDINIDSNKINIVGIGRLCQQKRFDRLIKACYYLCGKGKDNWHLYILGDGVDKLKLLSQVKELNLESKITLLGFKENPYKYLSKMDMFVCSSEVEGYSTAATEAIYLGVPVLTTDCGGMHEIIANSNAGLIVENSQEGLNQGLISIFEDLTLLDEMKKGARLRSKDFSTEAGIKEFENFIFS